MSQHTSNLNRRKFLRQATAVAAISVVPGHFLGLNGAPSPNSKLNIGCIGVGGRGLSDVNGVMGENIVAICDVDTNVTAALLKKLPNAKCYQDYRQMLDETGKQLDAVVVATPDHTHAVALMHAMKLGKHVYSEKPLAHTVQEIRTLMATARKQKVVTQLGNQGHSSDSIRRFCQMIWDGAIGHVREVHAILDSSYSRIDSLPRLAETHTPPPNLNWDLWLGPVEHRPYNPVYAPKSWRGWTAFGCGVVGDWVCHVLDPVFWALDLGAPSSIQAEAEGYDPKLHAETFPKKSILHYEFPAKGKRPPVKVVWHEGGCLPPYPQELEGEKLPKKGAIVIGDKGKIIYGSHGAGSVRIIPDDKMIEYKKGERQFTGDKVPGGNHHHDWLSAIKAGRQAGSNFDYGGPLTEIALLGVIAYKFLGQKLEWDGKKIQFTNLKAANQYLKKTYRKGWNL